MFKLYSQCEQSIFFQKKKDLDQNSPERGEWQPNKTIITLQAIFIVKHIWIYKYYSYGLFNYQIWNIHKLNASLKYGIIEGNKSKLILSTTHMDYLITKFGIFIN
jgi:hypothetical protein